MTRILWLTKFIRHSLYSHSSFRFSHRFTMFSRNTPCMVTTMQSMLVNETWCRIHHTQNFRILAIGFNLTKIIQSSMALAVTTLLVNFHYGIFLPIIMNLNLYIYFTSLQFCFFYSLTIIDIALRTHTKLNYGSNWLSILFILLLIILSMGLTFLVWYIVSRFPLQHFIVVFISFNALVHSGNVLVSSSWGCSADYN